MTQTKTRQVTTKGGSESFAYGRARAHRNRVPVRRPEPAARDTYEPARVEKLIVPPWEWIPENFINPTSVNVAGTDFSNASLLRLQDFQTRILKVLFTPDARGRYPYSTVLWSQPKKSGKTTFASAVGAWYAAEVEAPNEVLCLANNQEQSAGRIYGNALATLKRLGCHVPTATTSKPEVRLPNGTRFVAIANNFAGAAGGNYGLTLWSELWTFTKERERRLWEELTPVPTRRNSIRWVETYAGFEDTSELLLSLFLRIFVDPAESAPTESARPVPGLEDLTTGEGEGRRPACWHIPEEGFFAFIDHEYRQPWQQGPDFDVYLQGQAADLRETTFVRLWQNRWQSSEGQFIPAEWFTRSLTLKGENLSPMVVAIDASQRRATSSIVGVRKVVRTWAGRDFERFQTAFVRVYDPASYHVGRELQDLGAKKGDLDLEDTLAADVEKLAELGLIEGPVWYDPFQMHTVAMKLRKKKIPCVEFSQQTERALADTFLYGLYKRGAIDNFPDPDLSRHVTKARAKEDDKQRIRLIKGAATDKTSGGENDAAVAQSMAVWKASLRRGEGKKKKRRSVSTSIFG
jgi:phage terminase large subunit-like protein